MEARQLTVSIPRLEAPSVGSRLLKKFGIQIMEKRDNGYINVYYINDTILMGIMDIYIYDSILCIHIYMIVNVYKHDSNDNNNNIHGYL
jgi:hypothetical protein